MKIVIDNGINLAYTEPSDTVPHRMSKHGETFRQCIYEIIPNFYSAVGYGLANSTLIVGEDSCIVIDCTESVTSGKAVLDDFKKITSKPISTIIYTHSHIDHFGGVGAFTDIKDVNRGKVEIVAHCTLHEKVKNSANLNGPILNTRALYQFGMKLKHGPTGHVHDSLGPNVVPGDTTYIEPTLTFGKFRRIFRSGIKIDLFHAPSETEDEIFIYFPDFELVQTADILMGESFPNLYSIRGTEARCSRQWYQTIDKMRKLHPHHMIPSHGRPASGEENVHDILTAYRDAIQYVHNQTLRNMNKSLTPDELVQVIPELPPHLRNHPWLREFYGTVPQAVRNIYNQYLGYYQGDPTFLKPAYPHVRATKYIETFGGSDKTMFQAKKAFSEGDYQWCAELVTYIITKDPNNTYAKHLKADALEKIGYLTENTTWRNWYLTSAKELRGDDNSELGSDIDMGINADDIIKQIHLDNFLEGLCIRIDPEKSKDINFTLGFYIRGSYDLNKHDTVASYALEIRRCVVEFHKPAPRWVHQGIVLTEGDLRALFLSKITLIELLQEKKAKLYHKTKLEDVQRFFSYFDLNKQTPLNLTQPRIDANGKYLSARL